MEFKMESPRSTSLTFKMCSSSVFDERNVFQIFQISAEWPIEFPGEGRED